MTPDEFRASLARLKLSQRGAAPVLASDERTVRRWASGEREIPGPIIHLLALYEHFPQALKWAVTRRDE